jgi:16S rRNA processing protein RimM
MAPPEPATPRLEVGRVGKAHGLRGEVVVHPITNQRDRFEPGTVVEVDGVERTIETCRPHQDRWLVRFEGVEDRDAAEALRGAVVRAEPLGDAPEGEVWVHEVIGSDVVDQHGTTIGRVASIEANPAHDLLVLESGTLVPMVFVVAHEPGRVLVDVPDGLLDLNT